MNWSHSTLISFDSARHDFLTGASTPREFLEKCISRIESLEPQVQAFVSIDLAAARRSADESTARYRAGRPLSMVDGCPVGVKDIIETCDFPTKMGSPAYKNYQTPHDAACVYALRSGGAIIVGKTVTTEFAIGSSRQTTNPFDVRRTPGGSSSGSAAAVGAGMLPLALATQTQASTLRPASYCGAYAFKPTLGAFRMEGVHVMSPTSDHVGLIGASLQDLWQSASRISLSVGGSGTNFLQNAEKPIVASKPQRLIRLFTRGWGEMDTAAQSVFNQMLKRLKDMDVEVLDRDSHRDIQEIETTLESCLDRALEIVIYEMQWPFLDYVERYGDLIGPRIHKMMSQARLMTKEYYLGLLEMRRDLQTKLDALINDLNANGFILPSSSGTAPVGLEYTGSRTFPSFANLVGFPAVSLPLLSEDHLPFGVQLFHLQGRDADLCGHALWVDIHCRN